jgi:hypothetical protein
MSDTSPKDGATPAERESARRAYITYAKANREAGAVPEPFARYLSEWLSVARAKPLDAAPELDQYERRDYRDHYRSGEK